VESGTHPGGGLGACVTDTIAENGLGKILLKVSTGYRYHQGASQPWLADKYGISALSLVNAVEKLTGQQPGISEQQITGSVVSDFVGDNQLEAL